MLKHEPKVQNIGACLKISITSEIFSSSLDVENHFNTEQCNSSIGITRNFFCETPKSEGKYLLRQF